MSKASQKMLVTSSTLLHWLLLAELAEQLPEHLTN